MMHQNVLSPPPDSWMQSLAAEIRCHRFQQLHAPANVLSSAYAASSSGISASYRARAKRMIRNVTRSSCWTMKFFCLGELRTECDSLLRETAKGVAFHSPL